MDKQSHIPTALTTGRRSFISKGLAAASLFGVINAARADSDPHSGQLTKGDAAILRFLAAAEILETDFWVQYNELGGIQDSEEPAGTGNPIYTAKLQNLDEEMPQYIHDDTDDEFAHQNFINSYLTSEGAPAVSLEQFRTLQGQYGDGFQRQAASHESHAIDVGYELVDALSERGQEPRPRPGVRVSAGGTWTEQGTIPGNPAHECRSAAG